MEKRTDEEWLAGLQSPDRDQSDDAWQELYGSLFGRVYFYLSRYRGIPQIAGDLQGQAEEIAQETLLKICRALEKGSYDPAQARFLTWVTRIALNTAIDAVRKYLLRRPDHRPEREPAADRVGEPGRSRVRPVVSIEDLSEASDLVAAPADPMRIDRRDFLCRVMREDLSELQRTICILRYQHDYRIHEIADMTHRSDKAVENVLHQVRVKFRRRAQGEGFEL